MKLSLATLEAEALEVPHALGLPPCPHVLLEVGRELRCESPDVQKVAHLIANDAATAAMILKTVNSPYYGLSNKARSVQQAIAYLGLNRTACLLAGLLLVTARRGVERRFDPAVAAYLSALAFGMAGVALGAAMAVASPSPTMRAAHVTINVLGLVGLVVGGAGASSVFAGSDPPIFSIFAVQPAIEIQESAQASA